VIRMPGKSFRRSGILFILLGLLALSGCWDVEEINRRSLTDTIFFDIGKSKRFKIGVVMGVPGTEIPPIAGTTQQFTKRHYVITGEGDSLVAAWSEVQAATVRDIFFGQTKAVVLSRELAVKEDLNDILDFIGRMPLAPADIRVLVAKGDPEQLLAMANKDNYVPGSYIHLYFRSPAMRSLAIPMELWRVHSLIDQKTGDPFLPLIEEYQQMYRIAGTALFSRNRLAGELTKKETEILALLRGTDLGYLTVSLGDAQQETFGFAQVRSKTKITPRLSPDGLALIFRVDMEISGVLVESLPHKEIRWEEKRAVEKMAERMVKDESEKLIAKLQSLPTDPVGFGRKLRIAYPRQWKTLDWKKIYPEAKITVNPSFTITQTGLFE
jgi:spore germination protein KC